MCVCLVERVVGSTKIAAKRLYLYCPQVTLNPNCTWTQNSSFIWALSKNLQHSSWIWTFWNMDFNSSHKRMAEICRRMAQKSVQNSLLLKPGKLFVFRKIVEFCTLVDCFVHIFFVTAPIEVILAALES